MVKIRKKTIIFNIFICILFLFFFVYFISNYNSFILYKFNGVNGEYSVGGNVTFTNRINVININRIIHKGINDFKIKHIEIGIKYKNKNDEHLIFSIKSEDSIDLFSLNEFLQKFCYSYEEKNGYNDSFSSKMKYDFLENSIFYIKYIDENDNQELIEINLTGEKYSNNSFIYFSNSI